MAHEQSKDIADGLASLTSLSDLEDSPLTSNQSRYTRRTTNRFRSLWPADDSAIWKYWSLGATICCVLMAINIVYYEHTKTGNKWSQNANAALSDYSHPADTWKEDNLIETKYFRDLRYMTLDHDADYVWQEHALMSTGNLQLPDGNGSTSLKSISMYHQMHCLAKMRMALQQSREGVDIGEDWTDDAHWPHCFDYLRSSIMCFADGTLESTSIQPGPIPGTKVKVIDGGVETRYCRDKRPLEDLERQYGPNSKYVKDLDGDFEVAPGR